MINRIINKQGSTLLDLQNVTVNECNIPSGCVAHNAAGFKVRGSSIPNCYFLKEDSKLVNPTAADTTFILDSNVSILRNALSLSLSSTNIIGIIGKENELLNIAVPTGTNVYLSIPRCKFLKINTGASANLNLIDAKNIEFLNLYDLKLLNSLSFERIRYLSIDTPIINSIDASNCKTFCLSASGCFNNNAITINAPNIMDGYLRCSNMNISELNIDFKNLSGFSLSSCTVNLPKKLELNRASIICLNNTVTPLETIYAYNLNYITNYAFCSCTNLKNLIFGGSTIYSTSTFYNTNLKALFLPRYDKIVTLSGAANSIIPEGCSVYVPSTLLVTYKANTSWSYIASRIYSYSFNFNSSNMVFPYQSLTSTGSVLTNTAEIIPYYALSTTKNLKFSFPNAIYIENNALPSINSSTITRELYAPKCKFMGNNNYFDSFYIPECEVFNGYFATFLIKSVNAPKLNNYNQTGFYKNLFSAVENKKLWNAMMGYRGVPCMSIVSALNTLSYFYAPLFDDGDVINFYLMSYKNGTNSTKKENIKFNNVRNFYGFKMALNSSPYSFNFCSNKTFTLPKCENFLYFTSEINYSLTSWNFISYYPTIKLNSNLKNFWIAPTVLFGLGYGFDNLKNASCSIYIHNNNKFNINLAGFSLTATSSIFSFLAIPRLSLYVDPSAVTKYREQTLGLSDFIFVNTNKENKKYKNITFNFLNDIKTHSIYTQADTVFDLVKENKNMRFNGKNLLYSFKYEYFPFVSGLRITTLPEESLFTAVANFSSNYTLSNKIEALVAPPISDSNELITEEGEHYIKINNQETKSIVIFPPKASAVYKLKFEKIGDSSLSLDKIGFSVGAYSLDPEGNYVLTELGSSLMNSELSFTINEDYLYLMVALEPKRSNPVGFTDLVMSFDEVS